MGIISADFDATGQLLIIRQILEKGWKFNEAEYQLLINFKNAHASVRREGLCNILIEFGIPMKLVRVIKMCLNETYSGVREGNHLSDVFPVKSDLKQGDALSPLLFNFALEYEDGLKLRVHSTYECLVYADYVFILGGSVHTVKKIGKL